MPTRAMIVLAAGLGLSGCVLLAAVYGDNSAQAEADAEAESRRQAEQATRAQEQADLQLAAEIDGLRPVIEAEGATLEQVIAFVDKVLAARHSAAIEQGRIPVTVFDDAYAALDRQYAAIATGDAPELVRDRAIIEAVRGQLLASQGRHDEAATRYLAAIELQPSVALFDTLVVLQKSPATDAILLDACVSVRPVVTVEQVPDFVAVCLDAAGGNRTQLSWKTAKADLSAHDVEMARRAEADRLRAEEEARLVAEQAARDAEQAARDAQSLHWASAAVFAAGRCRFSNCLKDGWEASTAQGTVVTNCRFSNCLKDGWETRFPDGKTAVTNCRFSDCMKDGWETRFPDGSTATTSCRFSNCPVDGWETRLPDGATATTSCGFSDCFKDGWETRMPGQSVTCSCRFSDCLKDGTDCS